MRTTQSGKTYSLLLYFSSSLLLSTFFAYPQRRSGQAVVIDVSPSPSRYGRAVICIALPVWTCRHLYHPLGSAFALFSFLCSSIFIDFCPLRLSRFPLIWSFLYTRQGPYVRHECAFGRIRTRVDDLCMAGTILTFYSTGYACVTWSLLMSLHRSFRSYCAHLVLSPVHARVLVPGVASAYVS